MEYGEKMKMNFPLDFVKWKCILFYLSGGGVCGGGVIHRG